MSAIVIASIVTVLGAAFGIFLTHRLVGFRADGPSVDAEPVEAAVPLAAGETYDLIGQISELRVEFAQVQEQLRDRELMDEYRWRQLDEVQTEVRQLRRAALELEVSLEDRLRKSRELRERDLERFKRRQERDRDESTWQSQIEPERAASAR